MLLLGPQNPMNLITKEPQMYMSLPALYDQPPITFPTPGPKCLKTYLDSEDYVHIPRSNQPKAQVLRSADQAPRMTGRENSKTGR